jgi:GMP synthase (glutamine-hydrolysing)
MKPVLAVRHVPHEGLGTISAALERNQVPYTIRDAFAATEFRFDARAYSGLVVMGGPMNVDEVDRFPALAGEVRWLQLAVEARLPVLGVCLGSQLLAKSLGSRVYANRVKEIGWYEVELLPAAMDDRLFGDLLPLPRGEGWGEGEEAATGSPLTLPSPRGEGSAAKPQADSDVVTVFQWHGDTFDLPRGAVRLARSAQCENQAFRFGEAAYGLQFHIEATAAIIDSWLCQSDNCGELAGLPYIDPAVIRRRTPEELPAMTALGAVVFDRFAEMCAVNG